VILAVDTTSEFGSMALVEEGRVIGEMAMHSPGGFSHVLYDHLGALLRDHGVQLSGIDCFASAAGPGSFTGVRVGLAAVKGLAEAAGRPAVAVSNLQALAAFGERPLRATVLDARRGDIFGAVYDAALKTVRPEVVMKLEDWVRSLPLGDLEFISNQTFAELAVRTAPHELAAAIARIAEARFLRGEATDPALLDANYVRRSDAELFWKE